MEWQRRPPFMAAVEARVLSMNHPYSYLESVIFGSPVNTQVTPAGTVPYGTPVEAGHRARTTTTTIHALLVLFPCLACVTVASQRSHPHETEESGCMDAGCHDCSICFRSIALIWPLQGRSGCPVEADSPRFTLWLPQAQPTSIMNGSGNDVAPQPPNEPENRRHERSFAMAPTAAC